MSLNKDVLISDILDAMDRIQGKKYDDAKSEFAKALAGAIEKFVKSGTVTVTVTGITTAGSAAAQTQTAPIKASGDSQAGTGGIT